VAAHLVNLAWNGLAHLEAKPALRTVDADGVKPVRASRRPAGDAPTQ
jgi:hypothetical protein